VRREKCVTKRSAAKVASKVRKKGVKRAAGEKRVKTLKT
jgi:hypothetical protein